MEIKFIIYYITNIIKSFAEFAIRQVVDDHIPINEISQYAINHHITAEQILHEFTKVLNELDETIPLTAQEPTLQSREEKFEQLKKIVTDGIVTVLNNFLSGGRYFGKATSAKIATNSPLKKATAERIAGTFDPHDYYGWNLSMKMIDTLIGQLELKVPEFIQNVISRFRGGVNLPKDKSIVPSDERELLKQINFMKAKTDKGREQVRTTYGGSAGPGSGYYETQPKRRRS